jgi:hypothetical protein
MKSIYGMNISFTFLLQATRVLQIGNYDDNELEMIYDFMTTVGDETLNQYKSTSNIFSYNDDLELYVEIIDELISIFEVKEEYEKCNKLLKKKEQCNLINKKK